MTQDITIEARFRGPHGCGNGGYVTGVVARAFPGRAAVTLKIPAPLDTPLNLEWFDSVAMLCAGEQIVAVAEPATPSITPPAPVSVEAATAASEGRNRNFDHPFPECFVCGPDRGVGDGLRIFVGPTETPGVLAAPWIPGLDLADTDGVVRREFVHAALDCPGAYTTNTPAVVLGRLTARYGEPVVAGEPHVVMSWREQHDGRKHHVGTVLYSARGEECAAASAIWIEVDPATINR